LREVHSDRRPLLYRARSPRPLKEFTQRFPELAKAVAVLGAESVIIDAELAVFDQQLVSRFEVAPGMP
jgi:ATP-dependent DNA ligase